MKILLINKFLYPNGGSEVYLFGLGKILSSYGHEVQYFGMEHPDRICGNKAEAYTSNMDFHSGSKLSKLTYPLKTIYSKEARKKIRIVLDDFKPDVCHLNNFNYQLTPSIISEIIKWRKETSNKCRIIYTAHDLQLVCPNHLMTNPVTGERCEKCIGGKFINCIKGKCIHNSTAKSIVGAAEAVYWNGNNIYKNFDSIISPSKFLAQKLSTNPVLKDKIIVLHNFIELEKTQIVNKEDYVLYYGRYSKEKGIETLLKVVDELPDIKFVFAGSGIFEGEIAKRANAVNLGFLTGEKLKEVISKAKFTVAPSECYENCPFTVMESQMYGTPVIGSDIGGIPELIQNGKTGELFESGNAESLKSAITKLYYSNDLLNEYSENCKNTDFDTPDSYYKKLLDIYN